MPAEMVGKPKPRILYVSPVSDFKGGAEVVLRTMLANPLVQPVLAAPSEGPLSEEALAKGIPVCFFRPTALLRVRRPPRPLPMAAAVIDALRCAFRLRRLAQLHGCTIVHSNGLKTHILCALLGRLTDTRTLVHMHDIPYSRSEKLIWKIIAASVCRVILVSRPCYPGDSLPGNVEVVRNGIATLSSVLVPNRETGPLRLGFVGRFHPNKGLDQLIDWFAAVRRDGLDATLTVRGRPDPDNPQYWDRIQQRISDEKLKPFVVQDGWKTGNETYAGLDILLVTSNIPDPAPLVVPEAMGAGVIVAAYPAGGIPGMMDEGRTGLLVHTGEELVTRLRALSAKPKAMANLRSAAFSWVNEEFGVAQFHQRLATIYAALAS